MSVDLMTASEASRKWGFEESYVRQIVKKYPERIPKGEVRLFGKTLVITRQGMEQLTGKRMEEVWYFYVEKQQMIFKEVPCGSYEVALERLSKELKKKGVTDYEPVPIDPQKQRVGQLLENGERVFIAKKVRQSR